jgi:hypothetical protein
MARRATRSNPPTDPKPADPERDFEAEVVITILRDSGKWPAISQALAPIVEDLSLGITGSAFDALVEHKDADTAIAAVLGDPMQRSNQPPEPIKPEILRDLLAERYGDLAKRQKDLLAGAARFHKANEKITSAETAGKATDFVVQFQRCIKKAEDAKDEEKRPYLDLSTLIQNFFARIWEPLAKEKKAIEAKQLAFAKSERDRLKAEADAEAARKQKEADEAAAKAVASWDDPQADVGAALADAATLAEDAQTAASVAASKPADLTRVRGDYGGVSSMRIRWKIRPVENWRDLLTLDFLMPDQGALDLALKNAARKPDGTPILEIPGAELYADESMGTRG